MVLTFVATLGTLCKLQQIAQQEQSKMQSTPLPGNDLGLPNRIRRLLLAAPAALGLPIAAYAAPNPVTPILGLMAKWLQLCDQVNSLPDGLAFDVVYESWSEIEAQILALPCQGPADFACKVTIVEDCFAQDMDYRLASEALDLVRSHLGGGA
jgi:hypothetical protein